MLVLFGYGVGLPEFLFGGELIFTILKSLALQSKKEWTRKAFAVPCFIVESGLGITLTILLLMAAFKQAQDPQAQYSAVKIVASIVLITELMSVGSEGVNIWRKVRMSNVQLKDRQIWRALLNWIAFFYAITAIPFSSPYSDMNAYSVVAGVLLVVVVLSAIPSVVLWKRHRVRMVTGLALVFIGILAAIVLSFAMEKGSGAGALPQGACALTAIAFLCLPDFVGNGLHIAHVRALEVAAFAIAPTAVLSVAVPEDKVQRQVLFTLIPQAAALVVPLFFSYIALLLKDPKYPPCSEAETAPIEEVNTYP